MESVTTEQKKAILCLVISEKIYLKIIYVLFLYYCKDETDARRRRRSKKQGSKEEPLHPLYPRVIFSDSMLQTV